MNSGLQQDAQGEYEWKLEVALASATYEALEGRHSSLVNYLREAHFYARKAGIDIVGDVKDIGTMDSQFGSRFGHIQTGLYVDRYPTNFKIVGTPYLPVAVFKNNFKNDKNKTFIAGYYIGELKPRQGSRNIHVNPIPEDEETREEISEIVKRHGYEESIVFW